MVAQVQEEAGGATRKETFFAKKTGSAQEEVETKREEEIRKDRS